MALPSRWTAFSLDRRVFSGVAFISSITQFNVVCLAVQVVLRDKSVGFEQVSEILSELFRKVMLQLYPSSNMFNTLRTLTWKENMQ